MRADRLVAVLLMLQSRGRVTAAQVAAELEISERTARRDLDALAMAGLPVYSQPGRNGGWELAGGGRTDLSGLSAAETRALFLVAGTATATPEVRAALRKLVRALPQTFRASAQAAAAAVVVDPDAWDRPARRRRPPEHLDALQQAVVDGEQIVLEYRARDGAPSTRVVHPLGLVTKGTVWYLVGGTDAGLRTFRADRVTRLERTGQPTVKPPGFDLDAVWREIADEVDRRRAPLHVRARATPEILEVLRSVLGTRISIGTTEPDGRVAIEVRGHHVEAIAGELAGFGAAVEVLEPADVRERLARIGHDLTRTYARDQRRGSRSRAGPPV